MTNAPDDAGRNNADGKDSTVGDWFGQSVDRDAELADELTEEVGEAEAERRFDEQSTGQDVQQRRRGDVIDPDLGAETTGGTAGSTE